MSVLRELIENLKAKKKEEPKPVVAAPVKTPTCRFPLSKIEKLRPYTNFTVVHTRANGERHEFLLSGNIRNWLAANRAEATEETNVFMIQDERCEIAPVIQGANGVNPKSKVKGLVG